jgi:predicted nucleotidyltransferase
MNDKNNNTQLSSTFLTRIIAELDGEDVVAVGLTGSHARGTASPYSDVDIYRFGKQPAKDAFDRYALRVMEGRLVSITKATIAAKREELAEPDTAIWAVPGLRKMQILMDNNGELAALKQEAEHFQGQPLQPDADYYASTELMGHAEEACKVMGALLKDDDSVALYGTYGLVLGLPRILLVQRGVLVESENAFFQRAQESAGLESNWSKHFRIAAGFDTLPEQENAVRMRAVASLQLYAETVHVLQSIIQPQHSEVVEMTIQQIEVALTQIAASDHLKEHS